MYDTAYSRVSGDCYSFLIAGLRELTSQLEALGLYELQPPG
jgi:hypothetical protein